MREALLMLLLSVGPALAEDAPSIGYFTGTYERVGRTSGPDPALVDDLIRLDPTGPRELSLHLCDGSGPDLPVRRDPDFGEVPNILVLNDGAEELACQHFNDWDNYPLIACLGDGGGEGAWHHGARYTLFPAPDRERDCPAPKG